MSYAEMDQEFMDLVEMTFESDLRVEIIFEALKTMQEHPMASPKTCFGDWYKRVG